MILQTNPEIDVDEALEVDLSEPEQKPRKRGRPPKGSGDATASADTSEPKKRRRKSSKKGSDILARQIMGAHQMLAMLPGLEIMALAQLEADMLAVALVDVADEYGLEMSGKFACLAQLAATMAMIYVPRALELRRQFRLRPVTIDVGE